MKKYRIIVFSRQDFICRDVFVEAESADAALAQDWLTMIARDAWEDWGKDDCESFEECYGQTVEGELYAVCAVEEAAEFAWGIL